MPSLVQVAEQLATHMCTLQIGHAQYGTMEADAESLCVAHSTFRSSWPSPEVSGTLCFFDLRTNLRFTRVLQHYLIVGIIPLCVRATSNFICKIGPGALRNYEIKGKQAALAPACVIQMKALLQRAPSAISMLRWLSIRESLLKG